MIKFSVSGQAFTPVPTVFLKNYMCEAPDEYVKIYLYALCLANGGEQIDMVELETHLHMPSSMIETGFTYWERLGFFRRKTSGRADTYEILTEPSLAPVEAPEKDGKVYAYEGYNNMLNTILKRTLSAGELQRIYDFTDVFGLPQDVVITMVEYCVATRGGTVNVAYLDKVAQSWAEEGIDTREKAQEKIEGYKATSSGARFVMKQMSVTGKAPGKTELDYYNKWTEKWGFTQESILFAMRGIEFSQQGQPFKYLDAILRNLYENGATSSRKINEFNTARQNRRTNIKEVLETLQYSRMNIQPSHEKFYDEWEQAGYAQPIILLACAQSANNGSRKFESVDALLREWQELDLITEEAIKKHVRRQDTIERRVKLVYDCAGIAKQIGEADKRFYLAYRNDSKMNHDVLMYAAEISSMANDPMPFMRKVLADWAKNGVTTLEAAMQQNLNRYSGDMKNGKKSFENHTYTAEEVERQKAEDWKAVEALVQNNE